MHTYHSLALALTERSMAVRSAAAGEAEVDFDGVIDEANRRLRGDDEIVGVETEELRDRLLAGFEYVLVDEYQDIDERQYELVTHVARRPGQDGDERATILAVGDDDQTIYEWRAANVEFLRRFEADYGAERCYLAENYRSTGNIVEAANALIGHNRDRMKTGQPIRVDRARADDPPGGGWEKRDGIARGRVSVLEVAGAASQARALLAEIERLRGLDPDPDWQAFAVLGRWRSELSPVPSWRRAGYRPAGRCRESSCRRSRGCASSIGFCRGSGRWGWRMRPWRTCVAASPRSAAGRRSGRPWRTGSWTASERSWAAARRRRTWRNRCTARSPTTGTPTSSETGCLSGRCMRRRDCSSATFRRSAAAGAPIPEKRRTRDRPRRGRRNAASTTWR